MDARNWIRGEAAYIPHITISFVLPDEHDLVELGVRPALAYVKEVIDDLGTGGLLRYRPILPDGAP